MPSLGNAILTLRVKGDEFKAGLAKAKGQAADTTKDIGSRFGRVQKSIQSAAGKVPVFGGALAGLASPAGLAAAGIGLVVGGLTKMVTKTLEVGRSLGEMREATGVSAENLQIYRRAIEETNGDAGKFDDVVLRLTKSIGDANQGNKAAQDGFDALGLSWVDLADKSPDDALKAVVGAANESLSATDGAAVKAALLGRSYTGLGGFANLTTAEITALTDSVADNAVTMSGDQVTAVDDFDSALRTLRDSVGGLTTGIGSKLIPIITGLITFFTNDLLPPIKDIARVMGPVLMPILKAFYNIFGGNIKTVLVVVADVLKFVSQVLTGDFAGAWQTVQHIAQTVMNGIIRVYNNTIGLIPGVSKIDMMAFADNVEIAEDAVKDLAVASGETAAAVAETTEVYRDTAAEITQIAQQLTVDLEEEGKKRLASAREQMAEDYRIRQEAYAARLQLQKEFREATEKFRDDELTSLRKQFDLTEIEYQLSQAAIRNLTADQFAELIQMSEEFGIDDLAILHAHLRKMRLAQEAADREEIRAAVEKQETLTGIAGGDRSGLTPGGLGYDAVSGGKGRKGGLDASEIRDRLARSDGPIVDPYSGTIYYEGGGSMSRGSTGDLSDREKARHQERYKAELAKYALGAQHGAFVKGSRMGSLVRVGENYTDENITPVGSRGGGGSGSGQKMVIPVNLGGETLATIYVEGKRVAVREGRD